MPGICFPRLDAHAKQLLHQRKYAFAGVIEIEVLPYDLRVDSVLLPTYLATHVAPLPAFEPLGIRFVLLQPGEQYLVLPVLHVAGIPFQLGQKLFDALGRSGHLVGRHQLSVVVETNQLRQFVASLQ